MIQPISDITPFTLLDYPGKSACILWYSGCNMRCLYCYNPEIVFGKGKRSFPEIISFLQTRKGLLDAVVFSGGECLIHKNIVAQIKMVKEMGFLVKVDTNGSSPKVLYELLKENLVDYVALDFKSTRESFPAITQSNLFNPFEQSFKLLLESDIEYEVRTTYHSELIAPKELHQMIDYLKDNAYKGTYYIQYYRNDKTTIKELPDSYNRIENLVQTKDLKIIFR
ncbi:anaerobic ribonucleoside-triphosphate reductase activating protein [Flavobacterium sp.]|uniref:anaerobic ribonucleoside-triphosphate reductase activating protein n=1 Tax=Flavobacterium sp. TaxID=239 RepID=UPI00260C899B|nr:anaerobic ribonucleoside-triphosphate reductase activating protein [Flavobacterium sp.]MDD3005281.1 anaerobic ribonucleoside-triphosphate reductase activating protein [Flavobacterium sp.]